MSRYIMYRWMLVTILIAGCVGYGVMSASETRQKVGKLNEARAILVRGDSPMIPEQVADPVWLKQNLAPRGSRALGISGAADRMVEKMCPSACGGKGWGWTLECPALPTQLPGNTVGPAANGLIRGYELTDDARHLLAAFEAGDFTRCYSFSNGEHKFPPGNPFFLWQLNHVVPSATAYSDAARTFFFQELDSTTYGPDNYNTTSYISYLYNLRLAAESNYRLFDAFDLPKSAKELGSQAQADAFLVHLQRCLNELSTAKSYDVLALASAVHGLAIVNAEFDPTTGSFASEDSVLDLADRLATYQHPAGGFIYDSDLVDTYPASTTWTLAAGRWHSGSVNYMNATLTKQFTITTTPTITFDMQYDIENGWDFGFVEYSTDGVVWTALSGIHTDPTNNGITGCQVGYINETMTLPGLGDYRIRFRLFTDSLYSEDPGCTLNPAGFYIDNISIDGILDTCSASNGWTAGTTSFAQASDQSMQVTAYAIIALKAADIWRYDTQIDAAMDWILANQLANGGFPDPYWGENNLTNGEALYALMYAPECFNDGDVNNSGTLTPEDAQLAFQYYLGNFPSTPLHHDFCSSDCNGDGAVTPADSHCILDHYLDDSCNCADPIFIAPTKSATAADLTTSHPGNLVVSTSFDPVTHSGEIILSIGQSDRSIDAFGLRVNLPLHARVQNAVLPNAESFWRVHATRIETNVVRAAAFSTSPVLWSPSDALIRINYESDRAVSASTVSITDMVDDFSGWTTIAR